MQQKIKLLIITVLVSLLCVGCAPSGSVPPTITEVAETEIVSVEENILALFNSPDYEEGLSYDECLNRITAIDDYTASLFLQGIEYIGFAEYELIIQEIQDAYAIQDLYKEDMEEHRFWQRCYEEYPQATICWRYMKEEFGWSDIVCAGVLGNFMAETGGRTLDLDYDETGKSGLGLVQWIKSRRKRITSIYGKVPTIEEQLEFMKDELYGTDGIKAQVTKKQLAAIMEAKTPDECTYAFARYYERCKNPMSRTKAHCGQRAYNYFVRD